MDTSDNNYRKSKNPAEKHYYSPDAKTANFNDPETDPIARGKRGTPLLPKSHVVDSHFEADKTSHADVDTTRSGLSKFTELADTIDRHTVVLIDE